MAVAADQIGEIGPVPGRIIATVIIGDFSGGPAVERFVDDDEPCLIGKIEKFRVRRIVAGSQRVAADGLQKPEAAAQLGQGEGRSERPKSWCKQTPFMRNAFPFRNIPASASKRTRRKPQRSVTRSTATPFSRSSISTV